MQHLFLPNEQISGETARILGADHLHLTRVLRARAGDPVILLDNRGNAFRAVLVSLDKAETTARIVEAVVLPPEPSVFLTVAQALGKGDKFEQVIQHGTEVGAGAFIPLQAERCVVELRTGKIAERVARWQQIARSAAEQSHRLHIPEVTLPMDFTAWAREAACSAPALLLDPDPEASPLSSVLASLPVRPQRLTLAVGPEGGWSPRERALAPTTNLIRASLGPRVLRTETAALVAISQILYHFE
ncbi:MAG TPA: RsmE family RNA methyltransferase [Chthonomonadaceae bacterium]|nr:RsmE family RNA methyltransferase [Chthonomonadaceae bacterium]